MVWAAFGGFGSSQFIVMDRDPASKRGGFSAQSYLDGPLQELGSFYTPDLLFMQDNASIHTARVVKEQLAEWEISVIQWPPWSPDLNPIEHLWHILKSLLKSDYPELFNLPKDSQQLADAMEEALKQCWNMVPLVTKKTLWSKMRRRMQAVIRARGWYTKY